MEKPGPQRNKTYRDVKSAILGRITEGKWPPGALIPGEVELAQAFGCSRATVNRAMRELSDEGLLDRRRRAGTRVRAAPLRRARFEIPVVRTEIEAAGAVYRCALVSREAVAPPDWLRARLNLGPGGLVVHLLCMHYADGVPYQLEDRWINAAGLPQALTADFAVTGPTEWLIATVPYSEVEISFLAAAADETIGAHLEFAPGEPVFCVERTTWWQGQAITHVRLYFRRGHRMTTRY